MGVVLLALLVIRWAPGWLDDQTDLKTGAQAAAERGRIRSGLLTFLGIALAGIGAIFTARTFALNRRGQATERFTRAVDQIGSDKLDVRLGGIYALEQLAFDSHREHESIMEILSAYVRRRSRAAPAGAVVSPVAVDVQAVLTVITRRRREYERTQGFSFDLSHTNLAGARLSNAHLVDASLIGADLREAGLIDTDLTGAALLNADLRGAHLRKARLAGANLEGAKMIGAEVHGAIYDEFTIWPDTFDPAAAGARRVRSGRAPVARLRRSRPAPSQTALTGQQESVPHAAARQ